MPTIDGLCAGLGLKPSLIKIDVEGAEYSVLLGAKEALNHVDKVVIEMHPQWLPEGVTVETLRETLNSHSLVNKYTFNRDAQPLEWYGR